jgi:hypothetical protein
MDDYISLRMAAILFDVHITTIYDWRRKGLKVYERDEHDVLVTTCRDVNEFIEKNRPNGVVRKRKRPRLLPPVVVVKPSLDYAMTLEEIAEELGCTRENVRLIEQRALKKLRKLCGIEV